MNIQQASIYSGLSEQTIRRWIVKHKKLPATKINGKYDILASDLDALMEQPAPEGLSSRMDALEQRMERIEEVILSLGSSEHKPARKRAAAPPGAPETPPDIPPGAIHAKVFAADHGLNDRTFRSQIDEGHVPVIKTPKPHRPHEVDRWLTLEQRAAAVDYWQEIGTVYSTCDNEDCPCMP